ncbi:MAG: thioredoxin family protein [Verrucomicrobiota bacterium]
MRKLVLLMLAVSPVFGAEWLGSFKEGQQSAAVSGQDLLVSFTGSDWCEKCEVFDERVLSQAKFLEGVGGDFVLVELDFPTKEPELTRRNEPMRVKYGVPGFPVLVLADGEGRPYARLDVDANWTPGECLAAIEEAQKGKERRDAAFAEFEEATEPAAKAEALERALKSVPEKTVATVYEEEFSVLRKLSNDESELVKVVVVKERIEKHQKELRALMASRQFEEAVKVAEEMLEEELAPSERQMIYAFQHYALMHLGRHDAALVAIRKMKESNPGSPMAQQSGVLEQRVRHAKARVEEAEGSEDDKDQSASAGGGGKVGERENPEEDSTESVEGIAKTDVIELSAGGGDSVGEAKGAHAEAVLNLEKSHRELAAVDEAIEKVKSRLVELENRREALEKVHLEEHRVEEAARKQLEDAERGQAAAASIEDIEKRALELQEEAEELRKKAEALLQGE